ncbi:MAG: EAL domain-containing protein [Gammaproteobacteria bacterium]|nr:EAL domain-containing protein [Gammaproteobacteria bacterium]MDH5512891.1 EAL domain-containing protein [Gammaproteobacteria bacterium]
MKALISNLGRYSIRTKLITINLVTMGAVMLIVIAALLGNGFFSGRTAMLEDMRAQASMIAANSTAAVVFNDPHAATEILSALRASTAVKQATLFTSDRMPFAWYHRNAEGAGPATFPPKNENGHDFDVAYLDISQKVVLDNRQVGMLSLRADMSPLYQRLLWYGLTVCLMALVALTAGYMLLNRLQRAITMPIARLVEITRRISDRRDYSIRTPVESTDEIGGLARSFNEMLTQIQTRDIELAHELTERKRAEVQLDRLAKYDLVTGLPNRYFFNERLLQALSKSKKSGESVALMFLDLDNFKNVNDTLGHHIGDIMLHNVALRLQSVLHPGDVMCRVGGDEFAVILENLATPSAAALVAEKCVQAFTDPIHFDDNEIYVSVSVGISVSPQDTSDSHELLKNADTAMYYAKAKGKNTYQIFLPEMKGKALERLTMETSLRRALERQEFELYYQPLIVLPEYRIGGVEALIRWNHPDLGMIYPAEFISIAEEMSLIVPIGEWVLRNACLQAKTWQESGFAPIRIAVNLSGRQFKEENIVETVLGILRETGMSPGFLELELTESTLMTDDTVTIAKLNALRDAGIHLSIDDFGTGYSSMNSLKSFPISTLKIDRSFIRDLPQDNDAAAITQAIVAMALNLKLGITAEGVETREQAQLLEKIGCQRCQGYYFYRPMPASDITGLLEKLRDDRLNQICSGG